MSLTLSEMQYNSREKESRRNYSEQEENTQEIAVQLSTPAFRAFSGILIITPLRYILLVRGLARVNLGK